MDPRTPAAYQPDTEKHGTPISEPSVNQEWIQILVPASRFTEFFRNNMYLDSVSPHGNYRPPPPTRVASTGNPLCPPLPPPEWLGKSKLLPSPISRDLKEPWSLDLDDEFEVTGIRRYKGDGIWIVYKTIFEESRKPLENFIDGEYFSRQEVCDLVNLWNIKANKYPNKKRRCILCNNKAEYAKTICIKCINKDLEKVVYG